jgi:hypothetical protein
MVFKKAISKRIDFFVLTILAINLIGYLNSSFELLINNLMLNYIEALISITCICTD